MLSIIYIPCSLAVRYIVLEYQTKVCSSMYNVSQMRTIWIAETPLPYLQQLFYLHILHMAQAVGVTAQPPRAVSRSSAGRRFPTVYMVFNISSKGIN